MGDKETLSKARKELEELYLGVPDESVNLTFQDLAQVRNPAEKKKTSSPISGKRSPSSSHLAKLPSLDFSRGLESASYHQDPNINNNNHYGYDHHHHVNANSHHHHRAFDHDHDHDRQIRSMVYDDMSHVSGMSMSMSVAYGGERGGGRRRPGIPHSNICTVCSNYIYIFRHRCLVCGRVYCRQCVSIGMGEMTEGRKCIECLGRRFSQRYIQKAGSVGCCMGYSSTVKQQELKWAEKGPRRSGENKYGGGGGGQSVMASRSRSPISRTPSPRQQYSTTNPPSFVVNSPYSTTNPPSFVVNSPYSPTSHHAMPF